MKDLMKANKAREQSINMNNKETEQQILKCTEAIQMAVDKGLFLAAVYFIVKEEVQDVLVDFGYKVTTSVRPGYGEEVTTITW